MKKTLKCRDMEGFRGQVITFYTLGGSVWILTALLGLFDQETGYFPLMLSFSFVIPVVLFVNRVLPFLEARSHPLRAEGQIAEVKVAKGHVIFRVTYLYEGQSRTAECLNFIEANVGLRDNLANRAVHLALDAEGEAPVILVGSLPVNPFRKQRVAGPVYDAHGHALIGHEHFSLDDIVGFKSLYAKQFKGLVLVGAGAIFIFGLIVLIARLTHDMTLGEAIWVLFGGLVYGGLFILLAFVLRFGAKKKLQKYHTVVTATVERVIPVLPSGASGWQFSGLMRYTLIVSYMYGDEARQAPCGHAFKRKDAEAYRPGSTFRVALDDAGFAPLILAKNDRFQP